jgi:hypothetical protein
MQTKGHLMEEDDLYVYHVSDLDKHVMLVRQGSTTTKKVKEIFRKRINSIVYKI